MRSISRAEGIPSVSFNDDYRKNYRAYLLAMIEDQKKYHRSNAERNKRIAHILHRINQGLLLTIITACLLHIFWHASIVEHLSIILAVTLPAFGAAVAGVLSQGEFERIAHRSDGMMKQLNDIEKDIQKSQDASRLELTQQAQQAIDVMSQELFDWRVIFRAKPLEHHA